MVSSASCITKKKSSGRKKIDIKKIENTNSLQVAFSKRRTGLFKKASELCVMTGAQVAIFVNSPAGRMYVFGSPDVDALIQRSHLQQINNNNNVLSSLPLLPQNNNNFNQSYDQEVLNEFDAGNMQSEMIESAGGIDPEKTWNEMITSTGSSNQSGSNDVIGVEELFSESDAGIVSSGGNHDGLGWFDDCIDGMGFQELENYLATS